ncbi:hypothetical protein C5167_013865 [Papaver somniferum]|uniref:non-specific serine/threonine protein kinase n=1 Tax=Papaver somniferum TaxID=3469 RepID=A0A4Y7J4Z1_PAPSO|nr:serine/threonine-protein kinase STY46-like [Papaver somniferum]XP_026455985.1 serine/threonine-protein kinase STY46-like [Papaver somniferum]RZC55001.1 hypothetical protein C5167_013865 [Papaver somniferum]
MAMDDNESCNSRTVESSPNNTRHHRQKLEVYNEILRRLKESDLDEVNLPGFDDELWAHFNRLPARYALNLNVERAEDVLIHKRLLLQAHDPADRPAFEIRLVQASPVFDGHNTDSSSPDSPTNDDTESTSHTKGQSIHPQPSFGSSHNLEAPELVADKSHDPDGDSTVNASLCNAGSMHEITFSADDKPKLLSQLTALLAEIGLNIQEAHAFSTTDGYSLDVFVVSGWPYEEIERLKNVVEKEIWRIENQSWSNHHPMTSNDEHLNEQTEMEIVPDHVKIPCDGTDVWEIDARLLTFENKVGSGSFGDLYKGIYCTQEVAIKVLKAERVSAEMQREFAQEVYIMRKVRHKNVVQFIGACTRPPSLCIVTEFMSGGSIYDFLHKQKGFFKLPSVIRVAIDVSKGMNYLHQNKIIHRDLKAANLLMDENKVVKVADFGVARVQAQSGVMTAETGTYRWMAPEVIEHKPYDHKADIFSFAIVLWEMLTGKLPYEYLTPLQAAVGVVQKGLRPTIPKDTHPKLVRLLEHCWQQNPSLRPDFSEIIEALQDIAKEVGTDGQDNEKLNMALRAVMRRGDN